MTAQRVLIFLLGALLGFGFAALPQPAGAEEKFITLASTTSTANSGLLDSILPQFEKTVGFKVRVVVVGTGQALRIARNGDADVLLVHHRPSEEKFVAEGYGVKRYDVMYNDFVIVGPQEDPAGAGVSGEARIAMKRIAGPGDIYPVFRELFARHKAEPTE